MARSPSARFLHLIPWQAFLLVLFLSQPLGTARLSVIFAPGMPANLISCPVNSSHKSRVVTFVWFLLLAGTGIYNVTKHPGIFRAFDPSRAIMCEFVDPCTSYDATNRVISKDFVRTGKYETLAGVLLAVTGCEALFAK